MNEEEARIAATIGDMDQAGAAFQRIAPVYVQYYYARYYKALVKEGLPPEHAIIIVADAQRLLWGQSFKGQGK